jgi:hypothetical protein
MFGVIVGRMPRSRRHTRTHADGRPLKITFGEMREMACAASWSIAIAAITLLSTPTLGLTM